MIKSKNWNKIKINVDPVINIKAESITAVKLENIRKLSSLIFFQIVEYVKENIAIVLK